MITRSADTNNELHREVSSSFNEYFLSKPQLIVRSPGRINLIGEHTDYNDGFVLPAAIDKYIYIAISKREDTNIHLVATNLNQQHTTTLQELATGQADWSAYILGIADQLQKRGYQIAGFNAVMSGNIPVGAGMSSSAAVECAMIFSLNELFDLKLDKFNMVKLAQQSENEFVGVKCGIMDMFASMFGKKNHVIKLDCRSLVYEYFPVKMEGYKIVLFDTGVKHSLASGEYNIRRQQCDEGVRILQAIYPEIKNLRDANILMIENDLKDKVPEVIYNRCKYVVEEYNRVQDGCQLLLQDDLAGFGKKMFATHKGLSKLYEVSCVELDFLAEIAAAEPSVAGARMMGGGFGGCTINIIKEEAIAAIYQRFRDAYKNTFNVELKMYAASSEDGTALV